MGAAACWQARLICQWARQNRSCASGHACRSPWTDYKGAGQAAGLPDVWGQYYSKTCCCGRASLLHTACSALQPGRYVGARLHAMNRALVSVSTALGWLACMARQAAKNLPPEGLALLLQKVEAWPHQESKMVSACTGCRQSKDCTNLTVQVLACSHRDQRHARAGSSAGPNPESAQRVPIATGPNNGQGAQLLRGAAGCGTPASRCTREPAKECHRMCV